VLKVEAFDGIGLRPYPVAHLRASGSIAGNVQLSWTRRTRLEGDTWQVAEVPLGEDSESYLLRIVQGAAIVAEYGVTEAEFTYSAAQRSLDGVSGPFEVQVAQQSSRFGPGPFRNIAIAA
jgi:hypothetical protein